MSATAVTPCGYLIVHVARSNHGGDGVLLRASCTVDHSKLVPALSRESTTTLSQGLSYTTFVRYLSTATVQSQLPATFLAVSGIITVGDFNVLKSDDSDPHSRALHDVLGSVHDLVITASSRHLLQQYLLTSLAPITLLFSVILPPPCLARLERQQRSVDMLRLITPASQQISVSVISSPNLSVTCAAFTISIDPSCRASSIATHHLCNVR